MPLIYEGIYHAMKAGEFAAMAIISGKPSDYKNVEAKVLLQVSDYEKPVRLFSER